VTLTGKCYSVMGRCVSVVDVVGEERTDHTPSIAVGRLLRHHEGSIGKRGRRGGPKMGAGGAIYMVFLLFGYLGGH